MGRHAHDWRAYFCVRLVDADYIFHDDDDDACGYFFF
jgi:hypothetical protein